MLLFVVKTVCARAKLFDIVITIGQIGPIGRLVILLDYAACATLFTG